MIISEDFCSWKCALVHTDLISLTCWIKVDIPAVFVCLRPLSKTVRFNVLKVIPKGASDGGTKKVFAAVWNRTSVFVWQLWIFYSFSMFGVVALLDWFWPASQIEEFPLGSFWLAYGTRLWNWSVIREHVEFKGISVNGIFNCMVFCCSVQCGQWGFPSL